MEIMLSLNSFNNNIYVTFKFFYIRCGSLQVSHDTNIDLHNYDYLGAVNRIGVDRHYLELVAGI